MNPLMVDMAFQLLAALGVIAIGACLVAVLELGLWLWDLRRR